MSVCARCSTNMIYRIESFSRCFFFLSLSFCCVHRNSFFLYSAQKKKLLHFKMTFSHFLYFAPVFNWNPFCTFVPYTKKRYQQNSHEDRVRAKEKWIQVLDGILAYNTCYWNHLAKFFFFASHSIGVYPDDSHHRD